MSHLTSAPIRCKAIADLRAAAKHFGGELIEAKTFESYERNQKCDYLIRLPGVRYEVGIRKDAKTGDFSLHFDPFEADWGPRAEDKHDGNKLVERFGSGTLHPAFLDQGLYTIDVDEAPVAA